VLKIATAETISAYSALNYCCGHDHIGAVPDTRSS